MKTQKSKLKSQNYPLRSEASNLKLKSLKSFALCALVLSFALCALSLDKADASALSLGVYPPIIQIQIDPPANIKTPITIQNLGDETVNLDIILKPFTAKDSENGEIKYLLERGGVPGTNHLIFQKMQIFEEDHAVKNITLAPGEQKKLNFHIEIPKDEPISDYYFSVVFLNTPNPPNLPNSPNTQAQGGVATNVLLSIGKGQAKGVIEEFSSPLFLEKGPVPFTVRVKNTGKHVIAPIGQILIKNFFGQTVGKVDILPVNILSQTTRAIPDQTFNSQLSTLNFPKAFWPEKFLLGPYTATLTLALSDEGPVYKKIINFYGAPIQVVIGLIIAILIVSLIIGKVRKRLLTSN